MRVCCLLGAQPARCPFPTHLCCAEASMRTDIRQALCDIRHQKMHETPWTFWRRHIAETRSCVKVEHGNINYHSCMYQLLPAQCGSCNCEVCQSEIRIFSRVRWLKCRCITGGLLYRKLWRRLYMWYIGCTLLVRVWGFVKVDIKKDVIPVFLNNMYKSMRLTLGLRYGTCEGSAQNKLCWGSAGPVLVSPLHCFILR